MTLVFLKAYPQTKGHLMQQHILQKGKN